jgi:hypothetical protein
MQLADPIFGVAGDFSQFQQTHGFSIDGVDLTTSALPGAWRTRLIKVQNENTAAPGGHPQYIGWCLDKEDLCVAKLCAFREKDCNFVDALISDGLVDVSVIAARLPKFRPATAQMSTVRPLGRRTVLGPITGNFCRAVPTVSHHAIGVGRAFKPPVRRAK